MQGDSLSKLCVSMLANIDDLGDLLTAGLMWAPLIFAVIYTITDSVHPLPIALFRDELVVPTGEYGHCSRRLFGHASWRLINTFHSAQKRMQCILEMHVALHSCLLCGICLDHYLRMSRACMDLSGLRGWRPDSKITSILKAIWLLISRIAEYGIRIRPEVSLQHICTSFWKTIALLKRQFCFSISAQRVTRQSSCRPI